MALLKEITNPNRNGSTAEYWNIGERRFNNRARTLEVYMHGYKDKEWREDARNSPAFDLPPVVIQGEDFDKNMTISETYEFVKTVEPFIDAQDDI